LPLTFNSSDSNDDLDPNLNNNTDNSNLNIPSLYSDDANVDKEPNNNKPESSTGLHTPAADEHYDSDEELYGPGPTANTINNSNSSTSLEAGSDQSNTNNDQLNSSTAGNDIDNNNGDSNTAARQLAEPEQPNSNNEELDEIPGLTKKQNPPGVDLQAEYEKVRHLWLETKLEREKRQQIEADK
jgi:hypothetical protein